MSSKKGLFYGACPVPKGWKRATASEAVAKGQVRYWGIAALPKTLALKCMHRFKRAKKPKRKPAIRSKPMPSILKKNGTKKKKFVVHFAEPVKQKRPSASRKIPEEHYDHFSGKTDVDDYLELAFRILTGCRPDRSFGFHNLNGDPEQRKKYRKELIKVYDYLAGPKRTKIDKIKEMDEGELLDLNRNLRKIIKQYPKKKECEEFFDKKKFKRNPAIKTDILTVKYKTKPITMENRLKGALIILQGYSKVKLIKDRNKLRGEFYRLLGNPLPVTETKREDYIKRIKGELKKLKRGKGFYYY